MRRNLLETKRSMGWPSDVAGAIIAVRRMGPLRKDCMITRRHRPWILLASLGLAGCASVGPDYEPPRVPTPEAWTGPQPAAQPPRGSADLAQWWQRLDDPELTALVDAALRASPDVRSAQAKLRQARAQRTIANSYFFPAIGGNATASRSRSSEQVGGGTTRELYSAGFDASWELDVFGGTRRSSEAAAADLEAAGANLDDVRVSVAAEVATNYVAVRALQVRIGIARDNLATQTEILQLTEWRSQAGLVSAQDVEQARSIREQTRAQVPALETALAAAEHRLDVLLGLPPGALHARLAPGPGLPGVNSYASLAIGIPADTLRQRPDVRRAERQLAAATARVGVAQAARYPSFDISGSLGLESLTAAALNDPGASAGSLLGSITLPIFEAGRRRSQVVVQDALREQAEVSYEQSVLGALADVENALVAVSRNRDREDALKTAAASALTASQLARLRYGAGVIDFQSVLDTQRSLLDIQDSLANTQADGVLSLISLYKSLGGGWSPGTNAGSSR